MLEDVQNLFRLQKQKRETIHATIKDIRNLCRLKKKIKQFKT